MGSNRSKLSQIEFEQRLAQIRLSWWWWIVKKALANKNKDVKKEEENEYVDFQRQSQKK